MILSKCAFMGKYPILDEQASKSIVWGLRKIGIDVSEGWHVYSQEVIDELIDIMYIGECDDEAKKIQDVIDEVQSCIDTDVYTHGGKYHDFKFDEFTLTGHTKYGFSFECDVQTEFGRVNGRECGRMLFPLLTLTFVKDDV
jgi:hypothetical protein